ncbi:glutamate--tRNA ligase [Beggiatoa leptomitoformis]|uniref:Glutamate--tRNA ligase n=1 Tax=Beggiatoa leptomitoformis TaxID=288004 RepID=A0A2N9YAW5_9GAMM|nr:glutamate--tRNA ligase [Beggiatoa leptomitoformis]ALG67007.1 glutamate--tRNA ligase [Beggiatoa leptomitoformis]AUI67617.1 glutamate--tRNA ligase [Beggiatoa leptomitoformis]
MTVRTRFAPSPTGYLHVGGVRTALYSWLYARQHHGEFMLRIEDTDRERSTEEAVQVILEGMAWCGLNHDGDIPYQTHRFDRYKQVIQQLLADGKAYYCYCSKEEVEQMRIEQTARKEKPRYNGYWRDRQETPPAGVQPVVRFKNPLTGDVVFEDMIKGKITVSNTELDDLVIARADGTPTYNFCVVVDDWDMGITHVIRGDDHVNNTPRQINILQSLGAQIPHYAHVPMILGNDGQRLSKRHGAVSVMNYKDEGYLPEALLNYLIRLGWANGDQEIFSIDEMLALFKIENVNGAPSAFNTDKLLWLNQHYIKTGNPEKIAEHLVHQFQLLGIDPQNGVALPRVVTALAERAKTLREMAESSRMFYVELVEYDMPAVQKHLTPDTKITLNTLHDQLAMLTTWQAEPIHAAIHQVAEQLGLKLGKVAQPLRVAVTGSTMSPSIDVTVELIGQERTLKRLQQAITFIP